MPKKKFYAVQQGRKKGIFDTWDECKEQVNGFKNAKYKSFRTLEEAQKYLSVSEGSANNASKEEAKPAAKRPPEEDTPAVEGTTLDPSPAPKRPRVEDETEIGNVAKVWHVMIGFDGGSRGNPGVAGAGAEVVVVERTSDGIQRARTKYLIRKYLDAKSTNNMAEWQGVVSGMNQAAEHVQKFLEENAGIKPEVELVVQGDSQLVIRQLEGRYQVKHSSLVGYKAQFDASMAQLKGIVSKLKTSYQHVYRNDNAVADRLANEAMDNKNSWVTREVDGEDSEDSDPRDSARPLKRSKVYTDV